MRPIPLLLASALLSPVEALACGGFFCNQEFPIDQSAEQIVFGVDEVGGTVEVHVGISYVGASESFAWVVPAPSVPELFVSSDALFTAVSGLTRPQFWLAYETTGSCSSWWGTEYDLAGSVDDTADSDSPPTSEDGVTVVAQERVGPYETVTLQATSAAELLTWLQNADYDLPSTLDPVLAPYVADGQYFVALKLSAGKDTGDLAPLGMRYPATAAGVPIQLTSVAATPDMRLEVYVLGSARSVPDNYLHVTINEAAIDWFSGGANYEDVITLAANEAGGHGFATDFSGSTANLRGSLWTEGRYDLASLRSIDDPIDWVQALMNMGFPPSSSLLELFLDLIPYPATLADQGVSPQNFYDCLSCYEAYVTGDFDGDAATDALEARVVEGLRQAERLFAAHDHVSRMTSSLDAVEMTVDPYFVFNRDLPQQVSNLHQATVTYDCGLTGTWETSPRTLELSDGREIRLPTEKWVRDNQTTELEAIGDLAFPAAILIEDLGGTGQGEVVFDYREEAAREARMFRPGGCSGGGCDTGVGSVGALGLLGAALAARRRRSA